MHGAVLKYSISFHCMLHSKKWEPLRSHQEAQPKGSGSWQPHPYFEALSRVQPGLQMVRPDSAAAVTVAQLLQLSISTRLCQTLAE